MWSWLTSMFSVVFDTWMPAKGFSSCGETEAGAEGQCETIHVLMCSGQPGVTKCP